MIDGNDLALSPEEESGIDKNRQLFVDYLRRADRQGMEELITYLTDKTDFFVCPASTRFHSNYPGGLCEHSLHVLERLTKHMADPLFRERIANVSMNTAIITALLHDVCKANYYTVEFRNRKVNGVWQQVPFFAVADDYPYGHGEKSVDIIRNFIELTEEEKFAIRWHMGYTEPKEVWGSLDAAIEKYPLVLALHEADLEASKFLDRTVST